LILNEHDQLCNSGEEGELCVRGTSLAMGYYNDHEKTIAAFTQNPINKNYPEIIYRTGDIVVKNNQGEILFRGRKDTLIKHLGYRVELTEIEHVVVNILHLVYNGCVVYQSKTKDIVLVYEADEVIPVAEFRKRIGQILPKYMIPTKYIYLKRLPMNANGKLDRKFISEEYIK
jgi:acyl-coenzyme A synthetase/AMP-(fatty) acid ligase